MRSIGDEPLTWKFNPQDAAVDVPGVGSVVVVGAVAVVAGDVVDDVAAAAVDVEVEFCADVSITSSSSSSSSFFILKVNTVGYTFSRRSDQDQNS